VDGIIPALLYVLSAIAPHLNQRPPLPEPPPLVAPCDPGFGFPKPEPGCPDPHPLLGRVTSYDEDVVTLRTRGGAMRVVEVDEETVCTGVILVGYAEPLRDHRVGCAAFAAAIRRHGFGVPAALWFDDGRLVQLSELYRP
jgi:hypothetical protein